MKADPDAQQATPVGGVTLRPHVLAIPKKAALLCFLACVTITQPVCLALEVQTRATPVSDFLDSLGVCSAVSMRGERLTNTIEAATFTGIRWFRVGYESDIPVSDLLELHRRTGVRFSYGLMSGGNDIPRLLKNARALASEGALLAIEGNNEPNNWGVVYGGEKGGGTNSWVPVAKLQRDLYTAMKNDPALQNYPVWNISESGAQTDNTGLQFLKIPAGANTLMPEGTKYADFANCHNYMTHPAWPGLHDNQTWVAADPGPECKVDGLYGNYGLTWAKKFRGYSERVLQSLPRVTTETGVTIGGEITERIQGLLYLATYLDQFKRGWKHTAIYLLRDRTDEGGNQTFGLYRPDYTPRLAAKFLHNLTTILADKPAQGTVGGTALSHSIEPRPSTVHDMLLQKSDGTFMLVVWGERFTGGADSVAITFPEAHASLRIFDPTHGTEPIAEHSTANKVELTLTDHPLVIEIPVRPAHSTK